MCYWYYKITTKTSKLSHTSLKSSIKEPYMLPGLLTNKEFNFALTGLA